MPIRLVMFWRTAAAHPLLVAPLEQNCALAI
jgi:hypothetical protein